MNTRMINFEIEAFEDGCALLGFESDVPQTHLSIPPEILDLPVRLIKPFAFLNETSLISVSIPFTVHTIGRFAFHDCLSLQALKIGNGVREIESHAFYNCQQLTAITLPPNLRSLQQGAFYGCSALTSVTLPASLVEMKGGVFGDCAQLTALQVMDGNEHFQSQNGLLYSKDGKNLISVPVGRRGALTIPEGVTAIAKSAFSGCNQLTTIKLPHTLKTIDKGAFIGCHSLKYVQMPANVMIAPSAFVGITGAVIDEEGQPIKVCRTLEECFSS